MTLMTLRLLCWTLTLPRLQEDLKLPQPEPDLGGVVMLAALFAIVVGCVLLVVAVVAAILFVVVVLLLGAMSVISLSTLAALWKKRLSAGLRALHYQLCAGFATLGGAGCALLLRELMHYPVAGGLAGILGGLGGLLAGLVIAFLLDRFGTWLADTVIKRLEASYHASHGGGPPASST